MSRHSTPDFLPVSLVDQLAEVRREVKLRRHVYPRLVAKGSLDDAIAKRQIELMEQAAITIERAIASERATAASAAG